MPTRAMQKLQKRDPTRSVYDPKFQVEGVAPTISALIVRPMDALQLRR